MKCFGGESGQALSASTFRLASSTVPYRAAARATRQRGLCWANRAGCSVFSPPVRPTLRASSFEEALRLNRASSTHALGISRQSFGILRKIREVDDMMSPSLQERVFEVHPEVSLSALHGSPMKESKKSKPGRSARIHALERAWRCKLGEIIETHRCSTVARDDIVDAMAACWTAERVHAGTETRLPAEPPRDSKGLRMEIVR